MLDKPGISEAEYNRLLLNYLDRETSKFSRRSEPRVEKPIDIKPSEVGNRIVNWAQYQELVAKGEAQYPPKPFGFRG